MKFAHVLKSEGAKKARCDEKLFMGEDKMKSFWNNIKNLWNSWGRETKNFVVAAGLFAGSLFFKTIGIVGCGILLFLVFRRWYKMRGENE